MQRTCLGILRFCLSAWLGIAVFFVMLVIDLRQSNLFQPDALFNHPKVLFPLYYGFELTMLGTALVCALVGFWSGRVGRVRRTLIMLLVTLAAALALWDYAMIYRELLEMMNGPPPLSPAFHSLHRLSRGLNEVIVGATAIAALLALIPERSAAMPR